MASRTGTASNAPSPVIEQKQATEKASSTHTRVDSGFKQEVRPRTRKDARVKLQYLKNDPLYDTVKPLQVTPNFQDAAHKTNVFLEAGPEETLNDVRGREQEFTLDDHGFAYVHAPTAFKDWSSQPQIAKEYLPEMEQLLRREVDGCDEVVFYDARIRQEGDSGARVKGLSYNPFAKQVHVDNTEVSCIEKVRNFVDMKADYYLSGRVRMINIWRPINHPVYDCGLAIADGGKLKDGDVIECDRIRADTGQYWDTMGVVKHKPHFQWYYMYQQDEPDVLIFKNWDSATDVPARNCLHTAFDVPAKDIPENAPTRESIEVRAFVFTLPKGKRRPSGYGLPRVLESALEQHKLISFDDEHSITHRIRTDIDEGNEIKDAVLIYRRRERDKAIAERDQALAERDEAIIERNKAVSMSDYYRNAFEVCQIERDQACTERDEGIAKCDGHQQVLVACQIELDQAKQQMNAMKGQMVSLQKSSDAGIIFQRQSDELQQKTITLARELESSRQEERQLRQELIPLRAQESDHISYSPGQIAAEVISLHERIEQQALEIQKWKAEAEGRANEAVSKEWQWSVDEAVRREREKDATLITALTKEIEMLKAGRRSTEPLEVVQ